MTYQETAENVLVQTQCMPIEELGVLDQHIRELEERTVWTSVGILTDQDNKNTILLLLNNLNVISGLRVCLSVEESVDAVVNKLGSGREVFLGFYQGENLSREQIRSLEALHEVWISISDAISSVTPTNIQDFFLRIESDSYEKGRGRSISTETKRQVMCFSLGRCMFEGCGKDLGFDQLTGTEGNYSYLAHNIGSSETATRGGMVISGLLSDSGHNILLMCDKHHRLIDTVAATDFSAQRLSGIRQKFKESADVLLEGLKFTPIPTFSVLWPVGGHLVDTPTAPQVAQCLSVISSRAEGHMNAISDNSEVIVKLSDEDLWPIMPEIIDNAAQKILQQTHSSKHNAAVFAFGLMPQLVGLGAKIGNKTNITPMLKFRDGGWTWPVDKAREGLYKIEGGDKIEGDEEVIVCIALTGNPPNFRNFASNVGLKKVDIIAETGFMGNGCISHPDEGVRLLNDFHEILHSLRKSGVQKVHLITCASNAACMYIGMSIDNYHPEIIVYDFQGDSMAPRLHIDSDTKGVVLRSHKFSK